MFVFETECEECYSGLYICVMDNCFITATMDIYLLFRNKTGTNTK